ncbi:MAG: HEAT repeat domain-containing protein [Desulfovibrionaceae bacterium]
MADCVELLERLQNTDKAEVREAAFQAGERQCVEAVPCLAGLLVDSNVGVQEAADSALRKIGGPEVVEVVIPLLRSERAPVRNLAMDILREVGVQHLNALIELLQDDDTDVRIFAADILGATGSVQAVEPLGRAVLRDPEVNVRYQAAVSLGELGSSEASGYLRRAMKDDEWVQYAVVEALAKVGHNEAVTALLGAMEDCSDLVLSMILDALGRMGTVKAASLLLRRLEIFPDVLRYKAAKAIVDILGSRALRLLSATERETLRVSLLDALDDDDIEVQDAAMRGLAAVGGEPASWAILNIAAHLEPDTDSERLATAIRSLSAIGMTDALRKGLESGDRSVALTAIEALSGIPTPAAVSALMQTFSGKPLDTQRAIVNALAMIGNEDAKDFFVEILTSHYDGKIFRTALRFLGEKLKAEDTEELLFSFLDHRYNDVKEAALDACIAIGTPLMVERFCEFCGSEDEIKRLMGVYALGQMNPREHLDVLRRALTDPSPDVRKLVLEALASRCYEDLEILPLVAERLRDESPDVRLMVIELMGACPKDDVVPYLLDVLEDENDWVRIRAAEALGAMRAEQAVPKLQALVEAPNRLVGIKALQALGEVGGPEAFQILLRHSGSEELELADAAQEVIQAMQAVGGKE